MTGRQSGNPRRANSALRNSLRARVAASEPPCAACGQPIDYELSTYIDPRDGKRKPHPMRFELDEICPVSRWQEGGYSSPEQCANDPNNHQAMHRICNQRKSNKFVGSKPNDKRISTLSLGLPQP